MAPETIDSWNPLSCVICSKFISEGMQFELLYEPTGKKAIVHYGCHSSPGTSPLFNPELQGFFEKRSVNLKYRNRVW